MAIPLWEFADEKERHNLDPPWFLLRDPAAGLRAVQMIFKGLSTQTDPRFPKRTNRPRVGCPSQDEHCFFGGETLSRLYPSKARTQREAGPGGFIGVRRYYAVCGAPLHSRFGLYW